MQAITFEQFIETFSFRHYNQYAESERDKRDSKMVRFYIDDENLDNWFELGLYDYSNTTWRLVKRILSKEILQSYVSSMTYNTGLDTLEVYLQKERELLD